MSIRMGCWASEGELTTETPHAGLAQLASVRALELERPEGVEQQAHIHAGAGALLEGLDELPPRGVGLEDVDLEVDGVLRAADRLEHRGIELVTILEQLRRAAAQERDVEESGRESKEGLRAGIRVETKPIVRRRPVGEKQRADDGYQRDRADEHEPPRLPRDLHAEELAHVASSITASSGWWSEPKTLAPRSAGSSSSRRTTVERIA